MSAEPIIYSKNYVTSDDLLTVSSGAGSIDAICDRDNESQWMSDGANSDATLVTLDVIFYEADMPTPRTIDSFMMLNHNLKDYSIEYWDGAAFQPWLSVVGEITEHSFKTLSRQTTDKVRLTFAATQTANQEKAVGELVLCQHVLSVPRDLTAYEVAYRQNVRSLDMGDGSILQQVKRHTRNRFEKYEAHLTFTFLSESALDDLYALKETGEPFLLQPESFARPDDIFLVYWTSPWAYKYMTTFKINGFQVSFGVKEQ